MRFNPKAKAPQTSPFGDVYSPAGVCAACARPVFTVSDAHRTNDEPDPRGLAGPLHSLATLDEYPDTKFCWDCLNEHGLEGYDRCVKIATTHTQTR